MHKSSRVVCKTTKSKPHWFVYLQLQTSHVNCPLVTLFCHNFCSNALSHALIWELSFRTQTVLIKEI